MPILRRDSHGTVSWTLECRDDAPLSQKIDELAHIARHHRQAGGDTRFLFALVALQSEFIASAARKTEAEALEARKQIELLKKRNRRIKKTFNNPFEKTRI